MTISIFGLLFIVFLSVGLGSLIMWQVRAYRIEALENLLRQNEKKFLQLEMEHGNLEAFVQHLKEINQERKKKNQGTSAKFPNN